VVPVARSEKFLWPYLEPLPVPQTDWLELANANETAYSENLYMRANRLPSTVIRELVPKPRLEVTIPEGTVSPVSEPRARARARRDKLHNARLPVCLPSVLITTPSPQAPRRGKKTSKAAAAQDDQPTGE
jgi:hypothetical protein